MTTVAAFFVKYCLNISEQVFLRKGVSFKGIVMFSSRYRIMGNFDHL
jgi:hypothetical protein